MDLENLHVSVDNHLAYLSNPFVDYKKKIVKKSTHIGIGDILIGHDIRRNYPVILKDNEITTHYCFIGQTGSGKTNLAENFIAKLHDQRTNIFTPIIDIKGEWYESLKYTYGKASESNLAEKLHKVEFYEEGMIRDFAQDDSIVVFDFSKMMKDFVDNLVDLYSMIRDFVRDMYRYISNPLRDIQLNCVFEECALWFPNVRSELKEIFDAYDEVQRDREKRAKAEMDIEKARALVGVEDGDEKSLIKSEYGIRKLEINFERIWTYIKEIKSVGVTSAILARSRQCSIGFLVQRAALVLTSIITQTGTKFIKRQTDKNDIERIKASVGHLHWYLKSMKPDECIVASNNYLSYCVLDERKTYHAAENPKIKHYGKGLI